MKAYTHSSKMSNQQRRTHYVLRKLLPLGMVAMVITGFVLADRLGLFGHKPQADYQKYNGKQFTVVKTIDGDTIDVNSPDGKWPHTRIRLWGVDTPETVDHDKPIQHFGPEASEFTHGLCSGQKVRLELVQRFTRGNHGRLLAYVHLPDGRMLNRLLVSEGYAYADPRFDHAHRREFRQLQTDAMKAKRGLWRDIRQSDMPYYYRNLKLRERQHYDKTHNTSKPGDG